MHMRPSLSLALALPLLSLRIAAAGMPVTIERFGTLAVYPEIDAPATVVSLNDSRISAELSARIQDLPVRTGSIVRRGEALALLDCADYELALRREQAALKGLEAKRELAKSQLERALALARQRSLSEEMLDQRRVELQALEAEREAQLNSVASAQRSTGKCTVHAPFDAVVLERLGQVGELANPGTPLLRILDRTNIEISAQVQARDVASLQAAREPAFVAQGNRYQVRVRAVTAALDPRTRSQEVRLDFTATKKALPGASGRLVWRHSSPHVPADVLVRRGDRLGIFVEESGYARFHSIADALEGQPAPLNLPPDSRIILSGRLNVQDGDAIQVQQSTAATTR